MPRTTGAESHAPGSRNTGTQERLDLAHAEPRHAAFARLDARERRRPFGLHDPVQNRSLRLPALSGRSVRCGSHRFLTVDGSLSPFFVEITTTCPATAIVSGPGCSGSGGPNVLTATSLPWLGATSRARATGLPPSSFAAIASGVTPVALPLASLFPLGLPGCTAWVLADVIDVALPVAGAVTTQVAMPTSTSLVGVDFRQQVLSFVFDASGNLIELTGSNALTMTLGAF